MVERSTPIPRSATHVMVACKLPNGVILQCYEMKDAPEATPTGTHMVKKAFKKGRPYRLRGCAIPRNGRMNQQLPNGYSLTRVPVDFWEEWLSQNQDQDIVINNLVFAQASHERIVAKTKEHKKTKSGLEPLDPDHLPKVGIGKMQVQTYDPDDDDE